MEKESSPKGKDVSDVTNFYWYEFYHCIVI